jgi:hypothetical protein
MFGETTRLKDLASRKQLLRVESDLNRVRLLAELRAVKQEVHTLTTRICSAGLLALLVGQVRTTLAGLFEGIFHRHRPPEKSKSSGVSTILRWLRTGFSVWMALRGRER